MPTPLSKEHRKLLEKATAAARVLAESACRAALENLAVHEKDYRSHMTAGQRLLRNRLRARGRAMGDVLDPRTGNQNIEHLAELAAYEHWHRLLFTRFLTENNLLHTDEAQGNVPVSLQDCEELAPELGAHDGFDLACRFAGKTLPGVFRSDDPVLELRLALNDQVTLRKQLDALPTEVFTASDSLGWTYQFWQAEQKEKINASGNKIGPDELPSVTQLFTEDYMVDFLLDNTLGAWHAGKVLAANPRLAENAQGEEELRQAVALPGCPWKYLRFTQSKDGKWTPAAGTFDGWPKSACEIRALDPCMGSGHFVVAMFERLVALRRAEEKLDESAAVAAVIRDNLFGLEIDPRCTQIAAFNLALAAWRRVGHCQLPAMNLACCGLAPNTKKADWLTLAGDSEKLIGGMERLYDLFQQAAVLGSLIDPRAQEAVLMVAAFHELRPLLEKALAQETKDDDAHEMAVTARGLAKSADILASQFTLVATNVPYLGRGKQDDVLQDYCEKVYPAAKADLATCFVERCVKFCLVNGSTALVTPQNWWFLGSYRAIRAKLLTEQCIYVSATLGEEAWQSFGDRGPAAILTVIGQTRPQSETRMTALHAAPRRTINEKIAELNTGELRTIGQARLYESKDHLITITEPASGALLGAFADCFQGVGSTDMPRFIQFFWEQGSVSADWDFYQMAPTKAGFSNLCGILFWQQGGGDLAKIGTARKGLNAYGKRGVAVAVTRYLTVSHFLGNRFDCTLAVLLPQRDKESAAIVAYVFSDEFREQVRKVDQAVSVTESSFVKVPFDLAHWQKVAADKYPLGLPKPFSSDPTQWLFNGHSTGADQPLHVALARLLGYKWPRQTGSGFPDCPALGPDSLESLVDADGIVCLRSINHEQPAANRLRALLVQALGNLDERTLVASAGAKGSKSTTMEDWLRDEFFEQHCELFHQRPFIWHIWDGLKDGFHAFVNYHKLDHAALQKLTFSYLGDWIRQQSEDAKADVPGAAARLGAAQTLQAELAKIQEGEAPYDIFVRWKPLSEQSIGWNPDLNNGVRMNIRPFLSAKDVGKKGAGLLRGKPNIKWDKDRGKEPPRDEADYPWFWCEAEPGTDPAPGPEFVGNRWNNVHLTLTKKRKAKT